MVFLQFVFDIVIKRFFKWTSSPIIGKINHEWLWKLSKKLAKIKLKKMMKGKTLAYIMKEYAMFEMMRKRLSEEQYSVITSLIIDRPDYKLVVVTEQGNINKLDTVSYDITTGGTSISLKLNCHTSILRCIVEDKIHGGVDFNIAGHLIDTTFVEITNTLTNYMKKSILESCIVMLDTILENSSDGESFVVYGSKTSTKR